jgi:L-cysteine/cystine lyase
VVAPLTPDQARLAAVREALPALGAGIYLNSGWAGPLPAETARAMTEAADRELRTGRAHVDDLPETLERMAEARAAVAAIIGADISDVALTHATSDGMNLATWSAPWRVGDRAVTTWQEHPGGVGALLAVADRYDLDLVRVDVGDGSDVEGIVAAFDEAIRPGTRLVSLSHVLWSLGAVLPVARIAQIAHARGALVVLDAAQSVGAIPVAVDRLSVDFVAFPARKWLLGPAGMGALWSSPAARDRAQATFGGSFRDASAEGGGTLVPYPDGRMFEVSNYHGPSVIGMARSCGWLAMTVGLPWAWARAAELARRAAHALAAIEGVTVLTPRDQMATLVAFRIAGWPAGVAVEELGSRVFAISRAVATLDAVRISLGFFNSEDEVGRFIEGVALLAAHTPDTIPPRRTLNVLR